MSGEGTDVRWSDCSDQVPARGGERSSLSCEDQDLRARSECEEIRIVRELQRYGRLTVLSASKHQGWPQR